jgi:hypothetical protein
MVLRMTRRGPGSEGGERGGKWEVKIVARERKEGSRGVRLQA